MQTRVLHTSLLIFLYKGSRVATNNARTHLLLLLPFGRRRHAAAAALGHMRQKPLSASASSFYHRSNTTTTMAAHDEHDGSPIKGKTKHSSNPGFTKSPKKMMASCHAHVDHEDQDAHTDVHSLALANETLKAEVDQLKAENRHLHHAMNNLRTMQLRLTREKREITEVYCGKLWADLAWAQENDALWKENDFLQEQLQELRGEKLYRDSSTQDPLTSERNERKEKAKRILGALQLRNETLKNELYFLRA